MTTGSEPQPVILVPPLAEQVAEILPDLAAPPGKGPAPDNRDSLPATTTSEEDRRTEGQRRINYTWEYTQAGIAIFTVIATVLYHFVSLWIRPADSTAALFFSSSFTLVIGFYFGRAARDNDRPRSGRNSAETVWDFRDKTQQ